MPTISCRKLLRRAVPGQTGCMYLWNGFRNDGRPITEEFMRKPITPFTHGLIDYTTATMVAAAPKLMRLDRRASAACYALAGGYTMLSMLTDYPLAVKRAIPFK